MKRAENTYTVSCSASTSVILASMQIAWFHLRFTFLGAIFLIGSLPMTASTLDPMALYLPDQNQADQIIVPDGTQIELRFAQDVWGQAVKKSALPVQVAGQVQPGDTVHLVSVADVRIGERVVIAKGALAQATVVDVVVPIMYERQQASETGLFLRLDWLKSINGAEVPLRTFKKGSSGRFHVKVFSDGKGTKALPDKLTPFLSKMATSNDEDNTGHGISQRGIQKRGIQKEDGQKNWIPVGTTITSFVQGAFPLNAAEVEQAQAQLPKLNSGAMLSIYRSQDHKSVQCAVSCDSQEPTRIGERQYVVVALSAGQHSCQVDKEDPLVINVRDGEEIFAHLHPRPLGGGWTLKLVSASEGEAGVAAAKLVSAATSQ
jgi:hypothetical protein